MAVREIVLGSKRTTIATVVALLAAVLVVVPPSAPAGALGSATVLLSSDSSGTVGGVAFADEDIIAYDTSSQQWSMLFDGSSAGIAAADVNGFHIVDPFAPTLVIWMTMQNPVAVPGLGTVDDSDIVAFDMATQQFSMVLDGSTVSLTTSNEDIDAIGTTPDGRLLISTAACRAYSDGDH